MIKLHDPAARRGRSRSTQRRWAELARICLGSLGEIRDLADHRAMPLGRAELLGRIRTILGRLECSLLGFLERAPLGPPDEPPAGGLDP